MRAKHFFLLIVPVFALVACEPAATIMSRDTGVVGTGSIEGATFNSTGLISMQLPGENFSGTWVAVRDSGSQSFGLLNAYGAGGAVSGTTSIFSQSDSGVGSAILRSDIGNSMRCEFRYSLVTVTALGICQTGSGEIFDLQVG